MLAIDVADARGKSLAIAAAMSFSKFQGAMCPKGMSEIQRTMFNYHALIFGFPIGGNDGCGATSGIDGARQWSLFNFRLTSGAPSGDRSCPD